MKTAVLLMIAALMAIAGCGGEGSGPAPTGDEVLACMQDAFPLRVSEEEDDLDLLAQAAGDKGMKMEWSKNELNIAVERSESDAKNTLKAYQLFLTETVPNQLTRFGNAVAAYNKTPTNDEFEPVKACLEG